MNPYLMGAGVLAFVAVITAVGYKAEEYGAAQVREQWSEEKREWERQSAALREKRQNGIDEAAQFKEETRNDSRVIYRTIIKNVPTYVDRPVYSQPCMDSRGLSDVNAALAGHLDAAHVTQPDTAVPAADAP